MENGSIINITDDTSSTEMTKFSLLLIIEIFAIICTLFLLIYICFHWKLMVIKALPNHAILLIIIISFVYIILDLPFIINSYRLGYDNPRTVSFCLWWYWLDYTLTGISLFLAATASIQRYFLLFKTHLLRIRRTRLIIHYIPLLFCIIYPPIFYFLIIVFYPCKISDMDDSEHCSHPCYFQNSILVNIDWMINDVLPLIIIILAHAILVSWMLYSIWNLNHSRLLLWKRQKKLILQLLAFSSLYVIGWTPSTIVSVLGAFSPDMFDDNGSVIAYIYYMSYFICPLQPFICLFILPEPLHFIKNKVKQILTRGTVIPIMTIRS